MLLSMETYENMFSRIKMYDAIMAGKGQADKEELIVGAEVMQKMKNKYGL